MKFDDKRKFAECRLPVAKQIMNGILDDFARFHELISAAERPIDEIMLRFSSLE